MIYVLSLLIGVVAGLRALTAIAAASWAARLGALPVLGTPVQFLGNPVAPWLFSALAIGELVTDQLPRTPSRKAPMPFLARLICGAIAGAAMATRGGNLGLGLLAGALGAFIGTEGGAAARAGLARSFGKDQPAALLEDAVAVGGAVIIAAVAG
ncbi:MAG: DUF4126 domain-containing protein [Deltaproteobacteria bacterium]|nr:DUF4126 domain-containing protein [Deltaproteobacteria bacterium]